MVVWPSAANPESAVSTLGQNPGSWTAVDENDRAPGYTGASGVDLVGDLESNVMLYPVLRSSGGSDQPS